MSDLGILAALILVYALVSKRLEGSIITAPMMFVLGGLVLGPAALGLVSFDLDSDVILLVAELTLVLLLFTDASRVDLTALRRNAFIPSRLLLVGMPLTIVAGLAMAIALLPGLELWEAAILAAVLAPTDAALGQAVVENRLIPLRIRQAINIESGLNDGLSVPFLTVFIALADVEQSVQTPSFWVRFTLEQIGYGTAIGIAVGAFGGAMIGWASRRGLVDGIFEQLAVVSLPIIAWAGANAIDGNGFIAAFVAGLAAGATLASAHPVVVDFAADEGQLLNLTTFFIFGAAIAGPALDELTWRIVLYAVASLTVIRMIPVAISLIGSRLHPASVLFIGWFGPRGIASIVLALVVLEEASIAGSAEINLVATVTVLLSVVVHGVSAGPLGRRYGRLTDRLHKERAELQRVTAMPTRFGGPL